MTYETARAADLYRLQEGLGVWPHRGRVAAAGIGHSPVFRRWDKTAGNSIGALCVAALRRAIEDAGVTAGDVDGLVLAESTTTGAFWLAGKEVPADFLAAFKSTDRPLDGIAQISVEWIVKNMPELKNLKFIVETEACMSFVLPAAVEAVGSGRAKVCLAVKGWHNFDGRYNHGNENAKPTVAGDGKWVNAMAGPPCFNTAMQFQRYMVKYGKTHDMMAPFVVNSRRNGLLFPEGYWAQYHPEPLTVENYNNARWVAKPANLLDNDLPIHAAAAYVITTAERATDMKQKPVYVLGHAGSGRNVNGNYRPTALRSTVETLEEVEASAASTGRKICESAGITAADLSFENMYDGFGLFHAFHIEGLGYAGIKRGEALDLFQTDISISGPNPVSPSGGNIGGGRTRFWNSTDSLQQIQGRAGARQISKPAQVGISGGHFPKWAQFIVWSATPN